MSLGFAKKTFKSFTLDLEVIKSENIICSITSLGINIQYRLTNKQGAKINLFYR